MIPLNFYRDDEYVYYNKPNGITKKMTIADFESVMNGGGSGGGGDALPILAINVVENESNELVYTVRSKDFTDLPPIVEIQLYENGELVQSPITAYHTKVWRGELYQILPSNDYRISPKAVVLQVKYFSSEHNFDVNTEVFYTGVSASIDDATITDNIKPYE